MVQEAEAEQVKFQEALANPSLVGRVLHNNIMYQDPKDGPSVLAVNSSILAGEIEYRKQFLLKQEGKQSDFTEAFQHLRNAVQRDLTLKYDEPWGQMQPTRHILGALLFEQGEIAEAEAVYREDIKMWKDNLWGLLGLKLCLQKRFEEDVANQELNDELEQVSALFDERSIRADILPAKTCFCAQNAIASRKQPSALTSTKGKIEGKIKSSCCGGP